MDAFQQSGCEPSTRFNKVVANRDVVQPEEKKFAARLYGVDVLARTKIDHASGSSSQLVVSSIGCVDPMFLEGNLDRVHVRPQGGEERDLDFDDVDTLGGACIRGNDGSRR